LFLRASGVHDHDRDGFTRLACIGDSNTDPSSPDYEAWCEIIARRCPQWVVFTDRPLGRSGATVTPPPLPRGWNAEMQTRVALAYDPDAVVYAAGTNDLLIGRTPASIVAELRRLQREVLGSRLMYVASVPYWLDANEVRNEAVDETNTLLSSWVAELIDFTSALEPRHYYGRVHFSAAGHVERARRALAVLDPDGRCLPE
jgi:hypothetical protein